MTAMCCCMLLSVLIKLYTFLHNNSFCNTFGANVYSHPVPVKIIRPPTGPRSGPGWALHVMMGDNREGWFAKPCESGRSWILMMHSGRELFDKSKRLIVKRKLIYLS